MDISPNTIDPSALAAGVALTAAAVTWVLGCLLDELTRVLWPRPRGPGSEDPE